MPEWLKKIISKVTTTAKELISPPKAMEFPVGEGMTPEQKVKAEEVLENIIKTTPPKAPKVELTPPQAIQIIQGKVAEEVAKKRGEVPISNIPKELTQEALGNLQTQVFGFAFPVGEGKAGEGIISKIKSFIRGEKPPQPLAQEARKYKSAEEWIPKKDILATPSVNSRFAYHVSQNPNIIELTPQIEKGGVGVYATMGEPSRKGFIYAIDTTKLPKGFFQPDPSGGLGNVVSYKAIPKEAVIPLGEIKPGEPNRLVQKFTDFYNQAVKTQPLAQEAELNPIQKITNALKEAKPVRAEQEALYTAERAKRFAAGEAVGKQVGGEAGFYAEKTQFAGKLPKAEFESIRSKVGQEDIDYLFQQVKDNPWLRYTDTLTAREGLVNMLEGKVPTEGQLDVLNRVFPKDFVKAMQGKQSLFKQMWHIGEELANIPRSVMSSFDFSFGGRQGAFAAPTFRKEFANSWVKQFRIFGSEKAYQETMQTITKNPYFTMAKESGVSFTNVGQVMSQREERFLSSWAGKLPIIKQSGRAYTAFANKFRMDIFASMVKDLEASGTKIVKPVAEQLANLVNLATGRGELGKLAPAANILNAFFYSPRLISSRVQLLTNPNLYLNAPAPVRKQAWKMLIGFAGYVGTTLTLAHLAGAEVGIDPRSADFGKIKIGHTRIDVAAGFGQYIRSAYQMISGKYVSSTTGKEYTLGEGYKPMTRGDIALRLIEAKEAPIISFVSDLFQGTTITGEKVKISKEILNRLTPMVGQDIYDLAKDDPRLIPLGVLGIFGFGLQTYKQKPYFKAIKTNPWDKGLTSGKNPWD